MVMSRPRISGRADGASEYGGRRLVKNLLEEEGEFRRFFGGREMSRFKISPLTGWLLRPWTKQSLVNEKFHLNSSTSK